jgi:hypothetical protein
MPRRSLTLALALSGACAAPHPHPPAPRATAPTVDPCALPSRYVPATAPPASQLALPEPKLEPRPLKFGAVYTVWGAGYYFRHPRHRADVTQGEIAITGYVVDSNLERAPRCAVHQTGKADAEDCRSPIPTFWLGDRLDAALADCIQVMGFASNFAQIHDAILQFDRGTPDGDYTDAYWGQALPNPLPAKGAKLTVRGEYGSAFTMTSSGFVKDEVMGVLTYRSLEVLEPAPELATLPGMKPRPRR